MVQLGVKMKFVQCVLLVGIANVVHCGNQSGEAQCSGFGYELLNLRFDLLQETINSLVDLVTENKKNTEQALNEIKANNSRLSSSLERLENLVYNNKNSTEESFANLKASIFTNSSRLVQRIADLETLATTILQNQNSSKDNTRELLKNQARTTCLITGMSAVTSRKVVCEMDKFDGGWIVIQQRIDHKLLFNRSWTEYRHGFGTVAKDSDFWLGLEPVHLITNSGNCELAVEIKDNLGEYQYARYSQFKLTGEDDKYRLKVGGYSGTAGDKLTWHNNQKFSTYDSDVPYCAKDYESGWWYDNCYTSNLNFPRGGRWSVGTKEEYKLSYSRMMIRCG